MSKDDPEDLTAIQADDELLDAIGQGHIPRSSDPVVSFLTGWRGAARRAGAQVGPPPALGTGQKVVTEEMSAVDRVQQVEMVMRQWNAHQEWLGKGYGPGVNTLRAMAEVAVMGLSAPRTWHPGEAIPDSAIVRDTRGLQWHRDMLGDGTEVRVCNVPVEKFQDLVGSVNEVPAWESPQAQRTRVAVCTAKHPQRGTTCTVMHHPLAPSPRVHNDGWTDWIEGTARDKAPVNPSACEYCGVDPGDAHADDCGHRQPSADTNAAEPQDDHVVLERAALVGLQALLETVAAKLARVRATYKGPAVKHADTIADECTKAATLLRDVAGDSGG